jgi:hypothetical protein
VTGAGGLSLTPDADYTDNVNAGTATASYTYAGDPNHTGSSDSETFTIDQAGSTTTVSCPTNVTYTGAALTPCSAVATGAGGLNESLTVSYSNNTDASTATASASFAGDANHITSSDSETFTIDQASSTTTVSCPTNVTYTGSPLTPCTVAVTGAGGLSLTPAASYSNNTNAGTATASYTYAGDPNHTGSSDSETFTIDQASSTTVVTCPTSVPWTGTAQTPCTASVTGVGGLSQSLTGSISYNNNVAPGTATATATFAGDANHTGSTDTDSFTILPLTLRGFYQPVDMNGVLNVVKNGQTVPLKFEVFNGATELTDVAIVNSLLYAQMNCDASAVQDAIETVATGGTSLRYDTTGGQFIFNWKTPNTAGKCYVVTMTTQDDSSIIAYFKLK